MEEKLKNHHDAPQIVMGTDIAIIYFIGLTKDFTKPIIWSWFTGEDGIFQAYICDEKYDIPDYYELVFECKGLKVIDDNNIEFNAMKDTEHDYYKVYRAGERGCIIQLLKIGY